MKRTNTIIALVTLFCMTTFVSAQDSPPADPIPPIYPLPTWGITIINNTDCDVQIELGLRPLCPPQDPIFTNGKKTVGANSVLVLDNGDAIGWLNPVDIPPPCEPFGNGLLPYSWTLYDMSNNFLVETPPSGLFPIAITTHCVQNINQDPPCRCFCITTNPIHDHTVPITYHGLMITINPCP